MFCYQSWILNLALECRTCPSPIISSQRDQSNMTTIWLQVCELFHKWNTPIRDNTKKITASTVFYRVVCNMNTSHLKLFDINLPIFLLNKSHYIFIIYGRNVCFHWHKTGDLISFTRVKLTRQFRYALSREKTHVSTRVKDISNSIITPRGRTFPLRMSDVV